jgi:hypothetical protein
VAATECTPLDKLDHNQQQIGLVAGGQMREKLPLLVPAKFPKAISWGVPQVTLRNLPDGYWKWANRQPSQPKFHLPKANLNNSWCMTTCKMLLQIGHSLPNQWADLLQPGWNPFEVTSNVSMNWQEISGNWVLAPDRPTAIIHFLGGAFVATAPQITYRRLLERLALQGNVIVATPFINTFDHQEIAQTVYRNFNRAVEILQDNRLRKRYLPIYGVGHSLGCKLHLLIGSRFPVERAGNVLISFNNFSAKQAVPLMDQMSSLVSQFATDLPLEFAPSPAETNRIVAQNYQVRRNLLVQFTNDTIDQTAGMSKVLHSRFPGMVTARTLPGNHLTPLGPDADWQAGAVFTPWDAIAQWMRQEVYRELHQLERTLLQWLNPLNSL